MKRLLPILLFLAPLTSPAAETDCGTEATQNPSAKIGLKWSWDNPAAYNPSRVRFAWGAEAGTSVDVCGQDMSSFDINASFGLSAGWLDFAGIGAGANVMISNSCRSYPIYAVVRSDFSKRLRPVFIDLRGGISLNYLPENVNQTGAYASASLGFRLASGEKFRSYITAGYTFIDRKDVAHTGTLPVRYKPLSLVTMRLGVTF